MKPFILSALLFLCLLSCSDNEISTDEGFLDIKGNKIHYKVAGSGTPLLFVHGGYLNLDAWDSQADYFIQQGFQVIRFSELGHGKTISDTASIYGYEIINALAEKFTNQKINLVGLSWGAMLSVDFTLNHPEKVNKLVLVSPGLSGWDYFQDSLANMNYQKRKIAQQQNDTLEAAKLFHQNWVTGPRRNMDDLDERFKTTSLDIIYQTMKDHWLEDWSNLDTIPAIGRLEKIQHKTLIFYGEEDALDIKMITAKYDSAIPDSKLITLKHLAHSINMENPERFNQLLFDFIKK